MIESTLFGIRVCASTLDEAATVLMAAAVEGPGGHVCIANVDMVTRARRTPKLERAMAQARWVVPDGVPLVWMLRRLGLKTAERVYGPDFMWELCRRCEAQGLPIFLFGGSPAELAALQARLARELPRLRIAGAVSPPMLPADPPVQKELVESINASGAALLFVGLGCPKQEYWMLNHAGLLRPTSIGVGLAFAQLAGLKRRAPRWMARAGLEWLFRLIQEPRRLWRRYLVGNSLFLWYCAAEFCMRGFRALKRGLT